MTAITAEVRSANLLRELATAGDELHSGTRTLTFLDSLMPWKQGAALADGLGAIRSAATRTDRVAGALDGLLPHDAVAAVHGDVAALTALLDRPDLAVADAIRAANGFHGTLNWVRPDVQALAPQVDLLADAQRLESQAAELRATIARMAQNAGAGGVADAHATGTRAGAFVKAAQTSAGHLLGP